MALACSIVAGLLCIQAPIAGVTTLSIDDGGIWVNQTAEFVSKFGPAKTWKISTGRSMEWAPPRVDAAKLAKACAGEACQSYWRKCDDSVHPKKCTFVIDEGGGVARTFTVEAPNETLLGEALANAGVLAGRTPIAFAAMNQEAADPEAPYLRPQGPQPPGF